MINFFIILTLSIAIDAFNPVLLISFDGMRADKFDEFVKNNPNSSFSQFLKSGVRAEYMKPSFPTATFPNHITLVTGLNPESHGIVQNALYDPKYNQTIRLTGYTNLYDVKWWNESTPVWLTARNQGRKTASMMWVGSYVITRNPDIWLPYDGTYPFDYRINDVVNYIKKLKTDFTCLYFEEPDSTGHAFGPNSEQYKNKIIEVDKLFGTLIRKLKEEEIYDSLNIIVVSDHGMGPYNSTTTINIYDHVDKSLIDIQRTVMGVVSNIYATEGNDASVYEKLKSISGAKVYLKNEVPVEYSYSKNARIAPIVLVANEGYLVTNTTASTNLATMGTHGYNNSIESMRAIFLAKGPNFESNKTIKSFQNTNVYSLICNLLEIKCNPSNGTLDPFLDVLIKTSNSNNKQYLSSILFYFILTIHLFK